MQKVWVRPYLSLNPIPCYFSRPGQYSINGHGRDFWKERGSPPGEVLSRALRQGRGNAEVRALRPGFLQAAHKGKAFQRDEGRPHRAPGCHKEPDREGVEREWRAFVRPLFW